MHDSSPKFAHAGQITTLANLQPGESGVVESVEAGVFEHGLSVRLRAMGVSASRQVSMVRRGWFGGPLVVRAGKATDIAIRRAEAAQVKVRRV
ncbi:FeoA family protein [Xanthobacter sediminis]|uniref:FeoA family protein n=1 Tax=Xanthobacter sediminis TaxID=3119926 RepID=UPI00372CE127